MNAGVNIKKIFMYSAVFITVFTIAFLFGRCTKPDGPADYQQIKSELAAATDTIAKLTKELGAAKQELARLGKVETDLSKLYRDFTNANSDLERIKAAIGNTNSGITESCAGLAESIRQNIEFITELERRSLKKLYYCW